MCCSAPLLLMNSSIVSVFASSSSRSCSSWAKGAQGSFSPSAGPPSASRGAERGTGRTSPLAVETLPTLLFRGIAFCGEAGSSGAFGGARCPPDRVWLGGGGLEAPFMLEDFSGLRKMLATPPPLAERAPAMAPATAPAYAPAIAPACEEKVPGVSKLEKSFGPSGPRKHETRRSTPELLPALQRRLPAWICSGRGRPAELSEGPRRRSPRTRHFPPREFAWAQKRCQHRNQRAFPSDPSARKQEN